jgi:hypothetical protein
LLLGAVVLALWGCSGTDDSTPSRPAGPAAPVVEGTVVDPYGQPVAGLSVSAGECPDCADTTDAEGRFLLRLDPATVKYVLSVRDEAVADSVGAYYDFATDSLTAASENSQRVVMIPNVAICPGCYGFGQAPDDRHFLEYFKTVTLTRPVYPAHVLRRLDHPLPIKCWVADQTGTYGYRLREIGEEALAAWESRAGFDLFTEVADSNQADLLICFGQVGGGTFGLTISVDPPSRYLGTFDPQRMRCLIWQDLRFRGTMRYTTLHEIGHTLSIWQHSDCACHIMRAGGGDIPDETTLASLISDDEVLAVNLVRQLPPDLEMNWYKGD